MIWLALIVACLPLTLRLLFEVASRIEPWVKRLDAGGVPSCRKDNRA